MKNNAKEIVKRNLTPGENKLYDIRMSDLLAMDKRIAEKLAESDFRMTNRCLQFLKP